MGHTGRSMYWLLWGLCTLSGFAIEAPSEWVDPATGHRIIRLSKEPGTKVLYFHQNSYSEAGTRMVLMKGNKIVLADLNTRRTKTLYDGIAQHVIVGKKTNTVYFTCDRTIYAMPMDTGQVRELATLEPGRHILSGLSVNADESLLAGSYEEADSTDDDVDGAAETKFVITRTTGSHRPATKQYDWYGRLAAKIPMALFTVAIKTGEIKAFYKSTDFLNHVQFSPSDPQLVMFCHDGPWHVVDRIWTIRTDGTQLTKIHTRTMDMEIAGHEFFSPDGTTIWYDLQTPRSDVFWLAGYNMKTGERTKYQVRRENWSVHYGESPDGKSFAGDGGGRGSVAQRTKDGKPLALPVDSQWLFLFTPSHGELVPERLVDLGRHDYRLEPNLTFTPDGKWIVFQSNLQGGAHVYAVEVQKVDQKSAVQNSSR